MVQLLHAKMEFSRSKVLNKSSEKERDRKEMDPLIATSAADVNSDFAVFGEPECIKHESRQFNCDAGSALEQSKKAEMGMYYSSFANKLRKQIDEANVEQVLIDLAIAEAEREHRETEALREAKGARFNRKMEISSNKTKSLSEELSGAKELEAELLVMYQDVNALQNELEFIRVMDISSQNKYWIDKLELGSAKAELKTAKKELLSLREEKFKLMAEMDSVRGESIKIAEERERLAKSERKREADLQSLNSKLHKAMSKLELTASAEKRAGTIVANLSTALQQLRSDITAAKREAELAYQETSVVREETVKINSSTELYEQERLRAAAKDLQAVKESEAAALEQLRTLTESTIRERAVAALFCSTITLSKFEYYYLIKQARSVQEVADKKVAAAEAWIEAIQAGEKEMLYLKAETTQRRKDFLKRKNKKTMKKVMSSSKQDHEKELMESLKLKLAIAMPRRLITLGRARAGVAMPRRSISLGDGVAAAGESTRVSKVRRSSLSPTRRCSIAGPQPVFALRRKKVANGLLNFLSRSIRKNFQGQCIF